MIKTNTGHAAITFQNFDMREKDEFYAMVTLDPKRNQVSYSYEQLKKIHDNLGHPSQQVMEKMLDSAKSFNKNEKHCLNKLYDTCAQSGFFAVAALPAARDRLRFSETAFD